MNEEVQRLKDCVSGIIDIANLPGMARIYPDLLKKEGQLMTLNIDNYERIQKKLRQEYFDDRPEN